MNLMGNIYNYIDQNCDSDFSTEPFCEIDALIFAWLSYFEIENLQNAGYSCFNLTLSELVMASQKILGKIQEPGKLKKLVSASTGAWMLKKVSKKSRYRRVRIADFKTVMDPVNNTQFSVTSYILDTGTEVVAFRGTDTSVAGWKEDCMTSYSLEIPSQKLALEYLNSRQGKSNLIVTGHSKGGNLAIYSAAKCTKDVLNRIAGIYNFDGPGFCFDIKETENYSTIAGHIHSYIPGSSIVGMLLNHVQDYKVVVSSNAGIMQHYAFYWLIKDNRFVTQEDRNISSRSVDTAFQTWLKDLSFEDRKKFVEAVFSVFESAGVEHFDDMTSEGFLKMRSAFYKMRNLDPQTYEMMRSFFRTLMFASMNEVKKTALNFYNNVIETIRSKALQDE